MAIKALGWMVKIFPPPVYCYHEIVHNKLVVDHFRRAGVIFVNEISEVPAGSPVMLSAHGSAPQVVAASQNHNRVSINAVCPLVTKVHHELKVRARKGYTVIYVGHEGHDEAIGTLAVAPEASVLVETAQDVRDLPEIETPVALLAQTTLSHDDWADVLAAAKERFPDLWMPGRSDLCFATTNRQGALRKIASQADCAVIVGSQNSSNTVALTKVAKAMGVQRVYRVNTPDEVPGDLEGVVALTAGASAPDELVNAVLEKINPRNGTELVVATDEDEYFPPPRELRDLVTAIASSCAVSLGAETPNKTLSNDRDIEANEVLVQLSATRRPVSA